MERANDPVLFGDRLAVARRTWVAAMGDGLAQRGYRDYRRSDAFVARRLVAGPLAVGGLAGPLGTTRQGARKMVAGLEERGLARTTRDPDDGRRVLVTLTASGKRYARAVASTIDELHATVARDVPAGELASAGRVLLRVASALEQTRDEGGLT
ncbi:MAG: MarR family winged helix-turn-helix transcriptional regulator [Acidimicrobiales bacterium]